MRFFIAILFLSQVALSQNKVDYDNFNFSLLEKLVLKKINAERTKKNREALKLDSTLQKAAQNQSDYQAKKHKMTHNQTKAKSKNALERVLKAGGGFSLVGENVAYTDVHGVVKIKDGKKVKEITPNTYENIAELLVIGWRNSKYHYQAIIEKAYTHTGLKFAIDKKNKRLYATQVFGKK